jgi:hypothetical protein
VTLITNNEGQSNDVFLVSISQKNSHHFIPVKAKMNTSTTSNPSRSKEIEEKISALTESFHSTTDSVNKLQQTCADLLLDHTKHYQLDALNRLDAIEKKIENFQQ